MGKRAVGLFFIFSIVIGIVSLRLMEINNSDYSQASQNNSSLSLTLNEYRGEIYDCNMNKLVNSELTYYAAAKPTALALSALEPYVSASQLSQISERMKKGYPVSVKVPVEKINCKDVTIVKTYSRYAVNQTAVHLVGYLDGTGKGTAGIEKSFNNLLSSTNDECYVRFPADARGRVLAGGEVTVKNTKSSSKSGVITTLDKSIQSITEKAIVDNSLNLGAVIVMEIKTGEIKAMASVPTYDPSNIAASLNAAGAPFINRALTTYSVGSVFKSVVCAAAIEQGGLEDFKYECMGKTIINGITFNCHKDDGHGTIGLKDAMADSCNTYFINLAQRIDKDRIIKIAGSMGFGEQCVLAEGIVGAEGILPQTTDLDSPAAVANLAFGQGILLATPLQITCMTACLANGGRLMPPTLIKSIVDEEGEAIQKKGTSVPEVILSESTANKVKNLLVYTVNHGSGATAKPNNSTAGGKTATAQTGIYKNGAELYNTWFTGFFPADDPQYVITVLKENGNSGAADGPPIFKQIAQEITAYNAS